MQETVLLVHGVLMTARVMAVLARRLRGCGYRTQLFDYPTRRRSLRENAESLARFVEGLDADRIHLVGHSMGGLISARYLLDHQGEFAGAALSGAALEMSEPPSTQNRSKPRSSTTCR